MAGLPRILVTGFSVFPGAPVNPTEALMAELEARRPLLAHLGALRTEVLAVEYDAVPARLAALAAFAPDIAIHFGLAADAHGFRLERLARNALAPRADNAGRRPPAAAIAPGMPDLPSALPLDALHAALAARGLPVSWSQDAGGYLCNYLFYLSRAGACAGFRPPMAGFVHVPPLDEHAAAPNALPRPALVAGALEIVRVCAQSWRGGAQRPG